MNFCVCLMLDVKSQNYDTSRREYEDGNNPHIVHNHAQSHQRSTRHNHNTLDSTEGG